MSECPPGTHASLDEALGCWKCQQSNPASSNYREPAKKIPEKTRVWKVGDLLQDVSHPGLGIGVVLRVHKGYYSSFTGNRSKIDALEVYWTDVNRVDTEPTTYKQFKIISEVE